MRTTLCIIGLIAAAGLARADKSNDRRIDYIEFQATDIQKTKQFYAQAFGWKFVDYGPDYTSFADGRIAGGFAKAPSVARGGPLVVIYSVDLAVAETKIRAAGGTITKPPFSYPGGRRFRRGCIVGRRARAGRQGSR